MQWIRGAGERGFTLIELMIVIAVLGILTSVSIPHYLGARSRAHCTALESDVRNAAAAASVYYAKNNVWPTKEQLDGLWAETLTGTVTVTPQEGGLTVTGAGGLCEGAYSYSTTTGRVEYSK